MLCEIKTLYSHVVEFSDDIVIKYVIFKRIIDNSVSLDSSSKRLRYYEHLEAFLRSDTIDFEFHNFFVLLL